MKGLTGTESATDAFSPFVVDVLVLIVIIECGRRAFSSRTSATDDWGVPEDSTQLCNPEVESNGLGSLWVRSTVCCGDTREGASERVSWSCTTSILDARLDGGLSGRDTA